MLSSPYDCLVYSSLTSPPSPSQTPVLILLLAPCSVYC